MDGPALVKLLTSLAASKYGTVASVTLLIWDMALTTDEEIKSVWRAKKTLGTTIFFANRYFPLFPFVLDLYCRWLHLCSDSAMMELTGKCWIVYQPSLYGLHLNYCKNYQLVSTLLDIASIAVIECILIMRTHALYLDRKLFALLIAACIISLSTMVTCFLLVFHNESFSPADVIGANGCISQLNSPICRPLLIIFWIPFLMFETLIFALTAWKSYQFYKLSAGVTHSSTIMHVLARDGLLYYLVIMAVSMCNFLIWIFDTEASDLPVSLLKCLQATIGSRLLLNLRAIVASRHEHHELSAYATTSSTSNNLRKING